MPPETFIVTALPFSAAPTADFHVSLYVAHRLDPQGREARLEDFPHVREWTAQVARADITLLAHRPGEDPEPIRCEVVNRLDPDLWSKVFPPTLLVKAWETPDLTAKPWRTFPAHRMDVHARGLHEAAMQASPVLSPEPSQLDFLGRILGSQESGFGQLLSAFLDNEELAKEQAQHPRAWQAGMVRGGVPGGGLLDDLLREDNDYDAQWTAHLDADEPGLVNGTKDPSSGDWSAHDALRDVHAARRYYQRPEDAYEYAPTRRDAAPPEGPRLPEPEFHQRLGRLGDLSPLLRALGLVLDLDLHVTSGDELVGVTEISAQITIPGLEHLVHPQPRTTCAVQGRRFTAVSSSARWTEGMLRLGDEKQFTLLDLDPDASALKMEQYLRTVPRLLALQANRSSGSSAAPPTLRAAGFSIAEQHRAASLHSRVDKAPARAQALLAGDAPSLDLEQITRGLRLEVWDDRSREWHSLHRRCLSVEVDGVAVLDRTPDEGFTQGAALTQSDTQGDPPTMYAHEVLAGWEGWSLSAPRPEKPVVHEDDGREVPVEPDRQPAAAVDPVAVVTAAEDGTLPRLRYGRHYAFRAYAVDLAGNSRGPALPLPDGPLHVQPHSAFVKKAEELLAQRQTAVDGVQHREAVARVRPAPAVTPPEAPDLERLPADQRERLRRFSSMLEAPLPLRSDRRQRVEQAFHDAVAQAPHVLQRSDAATPAEMYAAALDTAVAGLQGVGDLALPHEELAEAATDVVTVPRPFLRWAPLVEPAVVPRHPYTWGESLLRLVIRSGVSADGTVTAPAQLAAAHAELGWRADSQRHLAPPKTSLVEAEMHGKLDEAIGTDGPSSARIRKKWLGLALRESGTFLQPEVADPDNPGRMLPVDGLSFHLGASAAPLPDGVTRQPTPVPTPLTLERGDPLLPGQYAVHDVDVLTVPYLPDPLATGLSLVFPDADPELRRAEESAGHLGVQSLTVRYRGRWPLLEAYRLVLQDGPQLDGVVEDNVLTVSVPPGEQLRVRLSSALEPDDLEVCGLWRTLHPSIRSRPQIAEAAADGWLWWLTPAAEMTLVHAVPRPVVAPRILSLDVHREEGATSAQLIAWVSVHAPSTERVDVEARWVEQHDDLAKAAPETVVVDDVACDVLVEYDEHVVAILGGLPLLPQSHLGFHHFGDTKHRTVQYAVRGTTRYREFFPLSVASGKEELSRLSETTTVVVPSSARPAKIVVRDVLPLFSWSDQTQVAQPFGVRRTRRAGLRIYLDRPWYTTGDGELLGVVLENVPAPDSREPVPAQVPVDPQRPVSHWAADPVWAEQQGPAGAVWVPLVAPHELLAVDYSPGEPATPEVTVQTSSTDPSGVTVRGYKPEYNAERGLWFVDVLLSPGAAFWPFVRLAVARFQPNSLPGCHLGPVVLCDFAQLPPERSLVVARTDEDTVKVAVSGYTGVPQPWHEDLAGEGAADRLGPSRTMRVRLERWVPEVGTDLGWEVLWVGVLPVLSEIDRLVTWEGTVPLGDQPGAPARPGRQVAGGLRVVVEEEERLPADPGPDGAPRTSSRIVYADEVVL